MSAKEIKEFVNYKIFPCKECGRIELSKKNKSGLCRSCFLIGNKRSLGHKHSKETKDKMKISKISEKNPMWKGTFAGDNALHRWVEKRLKRPAICPICNNRKTFDLANKGFYNRELKNWNWLCRKCHMVQDGRIKNLKQYSKNI